MIVPRMQVDDREVMDLVGRVQDKVRDLTEPMDEVGALLHASIIRNFEVGGRYGEVGSWRGGTRKWQPLQLQTLFSRNARFRKTKRGGGFQLLPEKKRKEAILQNTGRLKNSFTWDANRSSVAVGTNLVQAAIQHVGGKTRPHVIVPRRKKALAWPGGPGPVRRVNHPGSEIPARPFLVVQDEDMVEIKTLFRRYLTD